MRPWLKIVATTALVPIGIASTVALYGLSEARRDPIVRQARIPLTDWPVGAAPVRAVLISDVHLGSLAMDRGRLDRIVDRVDTLKPDIVLIAGDFINGHEAGQARRSERDLGAALNRLHAPLGVVAVLGNHDYYTDAQIVRRALARANVAGAAQPGDPSRSADDRRDRRRAASSRRSGGNVAGDGATRRLGSSRCRRESDTGARSGTRAEIAQA